jgi:hypothetical protein
VPAQFRLLVTQWLKYARHRPPRLIESGLPPRLRSRCRPPPSRSIARPRFTIYARARAPGHRSGPVDVADWIDHAACGTCARCINVSRWGSGNCLRGRTTAPILDPGPVGRSKTGQL